MIVAIDAGYGWTKGVSENGRQVAFPSVVAEPSPGRDQGILGGAAPEWRVTLDGHASLVGDAAMAKAGAIRAWDASAADRAGYPSLVYAAAGLLGAAGPTELRLGLPLAIYFDGGARQALRARFSAPVTVALDGRAAVLLRPERVRVLPQGAGAYFAALAADPGLRDRPAGVVDIGSRTTDFAVFAKGPKGLGPREDLCGSVDAGMADVYGAVQRRLEEALGKPVAAERVERILRWQDGVADVGGKRIDLRPWVQDAGQALADRIRADVARAWGDEADFLAAVFLAGGGAVALAQPLRGIHPAARTVADAPFANAVGFLAM